MINTPMQKQILFVDDESLVLQGLQRMLSNMRKEWSMRFASSGAEALALMAQAPADVVVSDMRMPEMNGAELLNEVMQHYPGTVRIILSGYADEDLVLRCVGGTHQYLSKPCDGETLRSTIRRAIDMDVWLENDNLKTLVSGMTKVPSLPSLYFEILKELRSPEAALDKVGATITKDPAMTAKMLQMVNSAFFGLSRRLTDPTEAVLQLGMETIKSLVLTIHVFSEFESSAELRGQTEAVYNHSLATALWARRIAQLERRDKRMVEESFTGGLLHDIGRLALAANAPGEYAQALALSRKESLPLAEAERAIFKASHAEVGGYLLGLWGLPISLVETAVFHHCPGKSQAREFSAVTTVHAANVLEQERRKDLPAALLPQLDLRHLEQAGVGDRVPVWRSAMEAQA